MVYCKKRKQSLEILAVTGRNELGEGNSDEPRLRLIDVLISGDLLLGGKTVCNDYGRNTDIGRNRVRNRLHHAVLPAFFRQDFLDLFLIFLFGNDHFFHLGGVNFLSQGIHVGRFLKQIESAKFHGLYALLDSGMSG